MQVGHLVRRIAREAKAAYEGGANGRVRSALTRVRARMSPERRPVQRTAELWARIENVEAAVELLDVQVAQGAASVSEELGRRGALLSSVEGALDVRLTQIERRLESLSLVSRIAAVTSWVRDEQLRCPPKISVILATRNRCALLGRAVESVRVQEYTDWELVVVDDGSTDGTAGLLEHLGSGDDRIVMVSGPHRGSGAARNSGLAFASGEIICYLDDDNTMQPLWLKAVAWAFERWPETEALYGAQILDVESGDGLPFLRLEKFDRRRLEWSNYIDLGVIAHRADLAEARFEDDFERAGDWDLFLRLTESRPPLVLPVVASLYRTSAPHRISREAADPDLVDTKARIRRTFHPRILVYSERFPRLSETRVEQEISALSDAGVMLAHCADQPSRPVTRPSRWAFTDAEAAITAFAPDLLLIYDEMFARSHIEQLSQLDVPFALRTYSISDLEAAKSVASHPLCIGVWTYPQDVRAIEGARPRSPLVTSWPALTDVSSKRQVVVAAGAGRPERDWSTLVDAFGELAGHGVDCRIAVATLEGCEEVPEHLRRLVRSRGVSVGVSVDVPHDQILDLLTRTAIVVHAAVPGEPLGMPRSIIEGMCAGASVVLRAGSEASLVAGRGCRTYTGSGAIVRHVTQVLAGGPDIDAERRFNRHFAWTEFADPVHASSFAGQLADALTGRRSW